MKLTIEFSDKVNKLLREAAERNGMTKIEVLRRAITLFEFVDREVKPGETLAIINENTGETRNRIAVI